MQVLRVFSALLTGPSQMSPPPLVLDILVLDILVLCYSSDPVFEPHTNRDKLKIIKIIK